MEEEKSKLSKQKKTKVKQNGNHKINRTEQTIITTTTKPL